MPLCPVGTLRKELDATEGGIITSLPSAQRLSMASTSEGLPSLANCVLTAHAEITGYQIFHYQ